MRAFLLSVFLLTLSPANCFAIGATWPLNDSPRFWILGEGLGHLSLDGYYFRTRENYDVTGAVVYPPNQDVLHYTNTRIHGGFGFAPRLSLYAQADARAVYMDTQEYLGQTVAHGNNYGFGDAFLALRWLLYRSRATDRVYPSEWSPETFMVIFEGSWNFPMYSQAAAAKPPLGDQSNDFSSIFRMAWYTNEWLAFSGSFGYTHRTAGYSAGVPWNIRADFSLQERHKFRFWTDFSSFVSWHQSNPALNPQQSDPIPSGSLLFKSQAPTIRTATLGGGLLLSREWEVAVALFSTATGVNYAKGWGGGLGFAWRPYQVPEIKYDEYRARQIERLQTENREERRRTVVRYGFRATIVKVSGKGNYIKIFYGEKDRVRVGDTFYVMPPDNLDTQARRPVASATAVQVQPDAAYLHVDERYVDKLVIQEGFETRRIYFEED